MPRKTKNQKPKAESKGSGLAENLKTKSAQAVTGHSSTRAATTSAGPRRLVLPKRAWHKPRTWVRNLPAPSRRPLPKARHILAETVRVILKNWKVFGGIALLYSVFNALLVSGLSGASSLTQFKNLLNEVFTGTGGQVQTAFTSFVVLVTGSSSNSTETSGLYHIVLLVIFSLGLVWAFRQAVAGHQQRIRDSFYQGMFPLVPFILILTVISFQLLPAAAGGFLYTVAVLNGIAADSIEKLIFITVFVALALWTLRMLTASLFALYIVTLPAMTPLKALRSAGELVYKRRLLIWRKLLFLPVVLLLAAAIIEVPLILLWAPAAYWVFFVLSTAALVITHGYLYVLYRKLL
ncbi:hypothetical protein EYC59_05985 [Candidatus Saccharibacteria bacterium]|nr:MAG: hypothetical protein EYC59_05985 [Candidatus Saccharibacteria bacterium]